jgi:large subunit ribosomal protein L23
MKTILKRPLITEKNTLGQETHNQYAFEVSTEANKIEIKNAIERKFNVKVETVRTVLVKGKRKTQLTKKGRFEGFRSDKKKAIVTLHTDDKIDLMGPAQ